MDLREFTRGDDAAAAAQEFARAVATVHVRRGRRSSAYALGAPLEFLLTAERAFVTPDAFTTVFGAGIIEQPDGPRPVVFVDQRAAPSTDSPSRGLPEVRELPEIAALLAEHEIRVPSRAVVLALPPAHPQYGPGRHVAGAGRTGTLGARVTTAAGKDGILTAGHVATMGAVMRNRDDQLADTTFSIDPAQVPAAQVTADVAVVEPISPSAWHPGIALTGVAAPAIGDQVTLVGDVSGLQTSRIMAASPALWLSESSGMWASVLLTTESFSQQGDSGGPVTVQGSADLVGHLVGGSGVVTSYVQSIDVQLGVTGVTLALKT